MIHTIPRTKRKTIPAITAAMTINTNHQKTERKTTIPCNAVKLISNFAEALLVDFEINRHTSISSLFRTRYLPLRIYRTDILIQRDSLLRGPLYRFQNSCSFLSPLRSQDI